MFTKCTSKSGRFLILAILALLFIVVTVICASFSTRVRFPDKSIICGQDVSNVLVTDVQKLFDEKVHNYAMKVTVGDQYFTINATDIGLVFLNDEFHDVAADAIENQYNVDPWSVLSLNRDKLYSHIVSRFNQKKTKAVPATVAWDDSDGNFKVIDGLPETWYDAELLTELVVDGVSRLTENLDISELILYKELDNTAQFADAEKLAMRANELLKLELEYVFNPRKIEVARHVIDRNVIASFLRVDSSSEIINVDRDAVLTYAKSIASDYDYFNHKDRFVTHDGARIDVKIPFQKQTVDVERFVDLISQNILDGVSGSFEVPYSGAVNFDGSYVEVSIPQQHLWVYIDGEMVLESDVVTGNESLGKLTPTGLNYVRGHLRDIELFGDYFVNYWMAITRGGRYGFHDADGWRAPEEYGGDTYKTSGSGGCVNMPREKIAIMYDLVPDGTPVVIYNAYFYD